MKYLMLLMPLYIYALDPIVSDGLKFSEGLLDNHTKKFQNSLIEPVTNGGTVTSIDGSSIYIAKPLKCSDSEKAGELLTISYSVGKNISISVRGDFNLDGSVDHSWGFSNVDGVCADGVVKCVAGWSEGSCKYFKWGFSPTILTINRVSTNNVNNCFCTNNSCRNVALSQKRNILDTLLAGITKTMVSHNKDHVFTETKNNGLIASQYAISQNGCATSTTGLQKNVSLEDLKNNTLTEKNYQDGTPSAAYAFMKAEKSNVDTSKHSMYLKSLGDQENRLSNTIEIDYDKSKINHYSDGKFSGTAELADLNLVAPTESYCKVEIMKDESVVYSDSSTGVNENNDMKRHSIVIRKCDKGACLYDSSKEKLLENCSTHTNNFKEATSKLQSLTEAAKDMVCTK